MSFQKDIAALIDCDLNRCDVNIRVARSDHNGFGQRMPASNQKPARTRRTHVARWKSLRGS